MKMRNDMPYHNGHKKPSGMVSLRKQEKDTDLGNTFLCKDSMLV